MKCHATNTTLFFIYMNFSCCSISISPLFTIDLNDLAITYFIYLHSTTLKCFDVNPTGLIYSSTALFALHSYRSIIAFHSSHTHIIHSNSSPTGVL